jgi:acyl-coenzyme A thioesterase PaaI-like protein
MNQSTSRDDANHCFVCGPDNPQGLQVSFRMEGDLCRAEYTPADHYCGYDGITHGGILFSLLDDVMANWLFLQGERAYTCKCEIRFREPLATGTSLLLESRLLSRKGRMVKLEGRAMTAAGQLVAETTASFIVIADNPA